MKFQTHLYIILRDVSERIKNYNSLNNCYDDCILCLKKKKIYLKYLNFFLSFQVVPIFSRALVIQNFLIFLKLHLAIKICPLEISRCENT